MSVEEEKPETATPPERQCRPEQDAAIAAQDQRESPKVHGKGDAIGQAAGERAQALRIEDAGGFVAEGHIGWDGNAAGVTNVGKPLQEAGGPQCVGQTVYAGAA
jgi:hypothetical protein